MTDSVDKDEDLLIVSFSYAPMLNPRAFRWTALAEEFARRGVRVRVVCSWQPGLAPMQVVNGVEIHRVGNRFVERIRALLAGFRMQPHRTVAGASLQKSGGVVGKLVNRIWRQIAWPDTTCVWYASALHKAEALLLGIPEATIVSVSPTFTAALVGGAVARKRNGCRWVLDMGDPFSIADESPPNNFWLYSALNRRVESSLFGLAHAVTLTNVNMRLRYTELHSGYADKLHIIPPLLTGSITQSKIRFAASRASNDPVRIVYVGSLYRQLRRPDFLLALFMGMVKAGGSHRLELHFFGDIDECNDAFVPYASQLGKIIQVHGVVLREEALAAVHQASIVVNLGNTNSSQLPSKLVEYAAAGKPILNIIRADDDISKNFMNGYHAILNLYDTGMPPLAEQMHLVSEFIEASASDVSDRSDDRWVEQFKISAIVDQYAAVLFNGRSTHD